MDDHFHHGYTRIQKMIIVGFIKLSYLETTTYFFNPMKESILNFFIFVWIYFKNKKSSRLNDVREGMKGI